MSLINRFRSLFARREVERDLNDELQHHIELKTQDNIEAGMSAEEARYAALRAFGGVEQKKEQCRDADRLLWLDDLIQDLRYGLRQLRRNPGFTAVAVITLALGIGANAAVFSVVDGILLKPLPYAQSNRLVEVYSAAGGQRDWSVSTADFRDIKHQNDVFSHTALYRYWLPLTFTSHGSAQLWGNVVVTPDFFRTLGVRPTLGRAFLPSESQPGKDQEVILSRGLWQLRFGGDRSIVGKTVTLNQRAYTVVGVMPAGFTFPLGSGRPGVWTPFEMSSREKQDRMVRSASVIARLRPGVRVSQAQADLTTIAARLSATVSADKNWGFAAVPLKDTIVGRVRPVLLILLAAVGFVLLIACINVANLTLARGATRRPEIAVREALGAGHRRMIRQLLTESLLLATAGGLLGLAFAPLGIHLVRLITPKGTPRLADISVNHAVLGYALAISLLSALLFGLLPALHSSKLNLVDSLKQGATGAGLARGSAYTRSLLVVSEVALAVVLLAGAGLMLKSFWRLISVDPGIDTSHVLALTLSDPTGTLRPPATAGRGTKAAGSASPQSEKLKPNHRNRKSTPPMANGTGHISQIFFQMLLQREAALPGVEYAALANEELFSGSLIASGFQIEGRPLPPPNSFGMRFFQAESWSVSPSFFRALGIALLRGRVFTGDDNWLRPPVVIINESMARQYWPYGSPIGRKIGGPKHWMTIVGVVGNTRDVALKEQAQPEMYTPYLQTGTFGDQQLYVRTARDPLALAPEIRKCVWSLDSNETVEDVGTLRQNVSASVAGPLFRAALLASFALLAVLLGVVGIYGVMSYTVAQRRHEIGVRMALGAQEADVLRMVIAGSIRLTLAGIGLGVAAAVGLTRLISSLLYDVKPWDPVTFIVVVVAFVFVAILSSWIPARRAAKVDPTVALRYE